MKVGDLVRFTNEHTIRPGYDYAAGWLGIVLKTSPERVDIFWVTTDDDHFTTYYESHIEAYQHLEVASEGR